ncbi:uncharacterized protein (DUF885 family) [Herbihabitans rhizosphaerae]|uniref:Uncharacterized protein (DUF885 family) n=1 Tax=Herbihabitans rhizosphaerae TaxID=1872711 RepID=A0A4Q7KQ79_9PSEU|nr:DUF885 domain-containing protein [Herbihabitans rhizosphaerae]RZS38959.1 uncharacterized protein (DUF885 family) [Herbihabitans rhizosphaerae]
MSSARPSVHEISDGYVDRYAALDPILATYLGIPGHDARLTDCSPDAHDERARLASDTLRQVTEAEPVDDGEAAARAVFTERVGLELEIHDAGLDASALNVIESPVQNMRQVFDLMPTDTAEDWTTIRDRLAAVPGALDSLRESLRHAAEQGNVAAVRQVVRTAEQCETWSGQTGATPFFATFVKQADVPTALAGELETAASGAGAAFGDMAVFLRDELAPKAPQEDAVGEDVYRLWSRYFIGASLDLREAYQWGWEELARIESEMATVAGRIRPGVTAAEAAAALDADPRYRVHGQPAFEEWMQQLSDKALIALRDKHFAIPDELMTLECRIAPPGGTIGMYYTGPTDDFSRPGRMWWSVPADKEDFSTWREVTTVYHEGVPGHHLQVATAVHEAGLNRFQRLMCWVSGHGEGWALYAERLMRELGYLDDDGDYLGMLDAHLFRAARVIVDIGMHLKLEIPSGTGFHEGQTWTPELGLEFLLTRTLSEAAHARDEIDRYLGWPGQAPSYKLGERLWLALREEARRREGPTFDAKAFHTNALRLGGMGLDTLRERLGG